jgi:hypothetical protein
VIALRAAGVAVTRAGSAVRGIVPQNRPSGAVL